MVLLVALVATWFVWCDCRRLAGVGRRGGGPGSRMLLRWVLVCGICVERFLAADLAGS